MFERSREMIESVLEKTVFASRWLLAPFYVGLAIGIGILLIKFVQELFHLAQKALVASESDAILGVLTLVDLSLTGSLLLIVMFSGYENFVSKIDHSGHRDWPEWMSAIDFTALKIKLLGSIVAISAIQLLKQFMAVKTASVQRPWSSGKRTAAPPPASVMLRDECPPGELVPYSALSGGPAPLGGED